MPNRQSLVPPTIALALVCAMTIEASALVVRHDHTDVEDVGGQDRWRTAFTFEETALTNQQGISVLFDPTCFSDLVVTSPGNPDWSVLKIDPDVQLPGPGAFDARTETDSPDLTGNFQIEYTWNGLGEPDTLGFVYYSEDFDTLESGETVPEPGTLGLTLGVFALAGLTRSYTRRGRPSLERKH